MPDFKTRSIQKEILDDLNVEVPDLDKNLRELERVNKLLGGYGSILSALQKLIETKAKNNRPVKITDVGCGGGDVLRKISTEFKDRDLNLLGVDANNQALEYARSKTPNKRIDYQLMNVHSEEFRQLHSDVYLFSLFMHHFTGAEISRIIRDCIADGASIIISDLRRSRMAYFLFTIFSRLNGFSHTGRHDGKLSILRSFTLPEWESILKEAGVKNYKLEKRWAFRHLIIIPNE